MRELGQSVKSPAETLKTCFIWPLQPLPALASLKPWLNHPPGACAKSALPEATEKETWDRATWRVCDKIFAVESHSDGGLSLVCKAPPGSQAILVSADPARFFIPPYVGHKGWIGMRLDNDPDWLEVEKLARRSYRLVAPRRLAKLVD